MALADVPGLGAYIEQRERNRRAPLAELQQVGAVQGLLAKMQAQKQDEQTRAALAASGGDVNKAIEALIKGGNVDGAQKLATVAEAQRKARPQPRVMSPGSQLVGPNNEVLHTAPFKPDAPPKPEARPEILRLQDAASKLPPGSPIRAQIDARIKMLGERSAGVTVNMPPSSDTVQGQDGKFYKFRIGKDGKTEVVPLQTPTGETLRPPESSAERKTRVEGAEQEATVESVRQRIASMTQKLQQNAGVVGPGGIARRMGETVAGIAAPDIPTPALDYQNELRLLLADIRKVVEKDPNLSNQERQNLYETLGGGTFQTPGSAIRTLNNVLGYMENKRMTGPGRGAQIEQAVRGAGWDYEPGKYDYRIVNGQVQRKAKGK